MFDVYYALASVPRDVLPERWIISCLHFDRIFFCRLYEAKPLFVDIRETLSFE